ncbi:MAG: NAD-binding protein [Xanthomonadaceae bacterium]|nr:NAD-binding protein [Xanthomonadaceae bacterium]
MPLMKLSPVQQLRIQLRRLDRLLRGPLWFPHLPLAVLTAMGGAWLLRQGIGAGWSAFLADLLTGHPQLQPRLLPQLLLGIGMLITALGLLFRSRVAWLMALMLALAAVLSQLLGHHPGGHLVLDYFVAIMLALLLARAQFDRSSVTASTLFALASVVMLLLYATFGAYYLGGDFKPAITDLATALYFALVTASTVGYGDITPQTVDARLFSLSIIVLGVAVFATSLTAVVGPLVSQSVKKIVDRRLKRMHRENHFVVIGNTSLAINTWRQLSGRGQQVTRLLREAGEADPATADIVVGEPGNLDVLRQAGADKAQSVLAMLDDDSDNAFVVLAVRELAGRARTVVAVNDARHLDRIHLVQPDVVIAPQVLGGELAAMIVCGEEVSPDFVMGCVLRHGKFPGAAVPPASA